jgi:AcrR family transcriptional regulator
VARDVGVSHAAAYHHFEDKTSLIAAIAIAAFADLSSTVEAAGDEAGDPVGRLHVLAQAYVRFALKHPDEFG